MTRKLLGVSVVAIVALGYGLPPVSARQGWMNATGSLAYKVSECGNLTLLASPPESDAIIAGVAARGLWINTGGTTWTRMSDVADSERILNRPAWIEFDPVNPSVFWEVGPYGGAGVYKTTDGGRTFHRLGDIAHNDFLSVDFTDPERRTLLAGGHEQERTVYKSSDGGATWRNVGGGIPPGMGMSTHPYAIDGQTYLVNTWNGPNNASGIFRTSDGGDSWLRVSRIGPPGPLLHTSTGVLYWPAQGRMLKSTDLGRTWLVLGDGIQAIRPVEVPGGRIVAIGRTTLVISSDGGVTWTPLGPPFPWEPHGLRYSPARKAFFMWRGDCKDHVAGNAIMRLDVDLSAPSSGMGF
jgi:photosystem II stability/assembly factor-like uncharacterized protein